MRIQSRIRIQLKILIPIRIQIQIRGGGVGQPKMCIPPGKILGTPLVTEIDWCSYLVKSFRVQEVLWQLQSFHSCNIKTTVVRNRLSWFSLPSLSIQILGWVASWILKDLKAHSLSRNLFDQVDQFLTEHHIQNLGYRTELNGTGTSRKENHSKLFKCTPSKILRTTKPYCNWYLDISSIIHEYIGMWKDSLKLKASILVHTMQISKTIHLPCTIKKFF